MRSITLAKNALPSIFSYEVATPPDGTLIGKLADQEANTVFAAPNEGGEPGFITLTSAHVPSIGNLEQRFRLLLRAWVDHGFDLPPGLEDDYAAALCSELPFQPETPIV